MKQSKLAIVLLAVLMVMGWSYSLLSGDDKDIQYNNYINNAVEYDKLGLYQKSIMEYDNALSIYNTEQILKKEIKVYRERYAEDTEIMQEYINTLNEAINVYPENADFVLELAQLYMDVGEEKGAYDILNKSVKRGVTSSGIEKLMFEIEYSYTFGWSTYEDVTDFYNGYYEVYDGNDWIYIDLDGEDIKNGQFEYAGKVGNTGVYLVKKNGIYQSIDKDKIVQGKYGSKVEESGIYSDNLIPLKINGVYAYYDILGNKQFGDYEMAGSFNNGQAAVMQDGKWFIIDNSGNRVSEDTFEDIILQADNTHLWNGIMTVKKNGVYSLFDGEKMTGSYEDVDIVTDDGLIAVCVGGMWGYVNLQGDVIIEPQFAMAKSFSNGLAAVYDGDGWGFIDETADIVIACEYVDTGYFNSHNNCMVKLAEDNWRLLINKIGSQ